MKINSKLTNFDYTLAGKIGPSTKSTSIEAQKVAIKIAGEIEYLCRTTGMPESDVIDAYVEFHGDNNIWHSVVQRALQLDRE